MKLNQNRLNAYKKTSEISKKNAVSEKNDVNDENPILIKTTEEEKKPYDPSKESVYRRVAKFLVLIGVNEAAKILPHLPPEQTEKIIPEIASIRSVSSDEAAVIFAEFETLLEKSRTGNAGTGGGVDTARAILEKAFGSERADEMIQKAVPFPDSKPFEYMDDMDAERVYFFIKDESVAVRALVLSHLKPQTAADVINSLPDGEKTELIRRLASLKSISPDVLRRVDSAMSEKVKNADTAKSDSIDGRGALAEILKKMSLDGEKNIISMLSDVDPELSKDLKDRLFTMDDFLHCDDKFLQKKLQSMSELEIAYLIAGKDEKFRQKILSNVSSGRGDIILEEEQLHKPMLKKDVDSATNEFMGYLRRKWEDGELRIFGRDDEEYV